MTPPIGRMTDWPEITCQRGHEQHDSILVPVSIGGPTSYHDFPPIPRRFNREFQMYVWDPKKYPVDGLEYCLAHDAVSETIANLGVWEVAGTILALTVCSGGEAGDLVLDFGAQTGWYSMLAASCGLRVLAVDAERENLELIEQSAIVNGWESQIGTLRRRVGPETVFTLPDRVRMVKIDVEGAERDVVRSIWGMVESGQIDHMMMEVSPMFDEYYPELCWDIVQSGYEMYEVPQKTRPPAALDDVEQDMKRWRMDVVGEAGLKAVVAGWEQSDVWFRRIGAQW